MTLKIGLLLGLTGRGACHKRRKMTKKQLIVARMLGLVIILFVSGCATTKDKPSDVRVSGDVTVSTVNRKGF